MPACLRRACLGGLAAVGLLPAGAGAQLVGGQLTSAGRPVQGVVTLLDGDSVEVARGITSPSGRYRLRAPGDGTYRMRVARIGQSPWLSEPMQLAQARPRTLDAVLPDAPLVLPDIVVRGAGQACRDAGAQSRSAAMMMEEARTAFALAEGGLTSHGPGGPARQFRVLRWEARFDRDMRPLEVSRRETTLPARWPFETLPQASIEADGFVQVPPGALEPLPVFYGFDGALLFGEWFLGRHCFAAAASDPDEPGLVGVDFVALDRRPVDDIEGTLWLDAATLALRRVDFRYVGAEVFDPERRGGGTLHFVQLPDGTWLPGAWVLRAVAPRTREVISPVHGRRQQRVEVGEYREVGGTIRAVIGARGDTQLVMPVDSLLRVPAAPTP